MGSVTRFQSISSEYAVILSNVSHHHSVLDYVKAVAFIVGSNQIRCAYKEDNTIIIYMKEKQYVRDVIEAGVRIDGVVANVGYGIVPFTKILLSNVDPILPNGVIQEYLARYGEFESDVICEKISSDIEYAHILSDSRYIYMKTRNIEISKKLHLTYNGVDYTIDVAVEYPETQNGLETPENTDAQWPVNQSIEIEAAVNEKTRQPENTEDAIESRCKRLKSSSSVSLYESNTPVVQYKAPCQEKLNSGKPIVLCEDLKFEDRNNDVSPVQDKFCHQKIHRFNKETNAEANSSSKFDTISPKNGIAAHSNPINSGSNFRSVDNSPPTLSTFAEEFPVPNSDSVSADAESEFPDLNTLANKFGMQSCKNGIETMVVSSVEVVPNLHYLSFDSNKSRQENMTNGENKHTSKPVKKFLEETKYKRNQVHSLLTYIDDETPDAIHSVISELEKAIGGATVSEKIRLNRLIDNLHKHLDDKS